MLFVFFFFLIHPMYALRFRPPSPALRRSWGHFEYAAPPYGFAHPT